MIQTKTDNRKPIRLLQCVGDVILEGLACIISEHLMEMKHGALTEGVPSLGRSFDSIDIFPRSASHLGLDDLLPWLPGFVVEEVSITLEHLCSFHGDGKLCSFYGLMAFL